MGRALPPSADRLRPVAEADARGRGGAGRGLLLQYGLQHANYTDNDTPFSQVLRDNVASWEQAPIEASRVQLVLDKICAFPRVGRGGAKRPCPGSVAPASPRLAPAPSWPTLSRTAWEKGVVESSA